LPAARNTPPNVNCSEFAAALSNNFFFPINSPPSSHSLPLPTRTLPYTGISEPFLPFQLPGNRSIPLHTASTANDSALDQNYGFPTDFAFDGLTDDMLVDQACYDSSMDQARYNSSMDIPSDYEYGSQELLVETSSPNLREHCLPIDDISNVTNILDCSFSPQPGPELLLDRNATFLSPPENYWQSTIDTSSNMSCQSNHISASQWMGGSNHELETGYSYKQVYDMTPKITPAPASFVVSSSVPNPQSPSQEALQGIPKPTCKVLVVKKKRVSCSPYKSHISYD
jgi:hypothetical protein